MKEMVCGVSSGLVAPARKPQDVEGAPPPECTSPLRGTDSGFCVMQVLVALQRLLNALGAESPSSYPILQPLLRHCTDPGQVYRLS